MYLTARASCGKCWTGAGLPCSLLCVWLFCKNGMAWDECVHVCFVCVSILSLSHVCVCAQEQACHQGVRGHGRHGESRAYSVCVVICITSERVCAVHEGVAYISSIQGLHRLNGGGQIATMCVCVFTFACGRTRSRIESCRLISFLPGRLCVSV